MAKKKPNNKKSEIEQEEGYIAFLEKRLASENYKANATPEEVEETKEKLKKAKLKLRFMQPNQGK